MIWRMRLGDHLWLAAYQGPLGSAPMERRARDQRAARMALAAGLAFAGDRRDLTWSLSHSNGVGAAIVGAGGRAVGVDVVAVGRVAERHAKAITTRREWRKVRNSGMPPAAVWGIKEAAAKASGDPVGTFASGIQIVCDTGRPVCVRVSRGKHRIFSGDWIIVAGCLFAWVWASSRVPDQQLHRKQNCH